ncbi:MAG: metallophosphoesterase, partial [Parachlamydiaceae bacterium]
FVQVILAIQKCYLHLNHAKKCHDLPGGDLLIIAGDLTARNTLDEYERFNQWLKGLNYRCKIVIAGNHDGLLESGKVVIEDGSNGIHYLCDSGFEFEGLKIWGSPYTPTFLNWYFMRNRGKDIKKHWLIQPIVF